MSTYRILFRSALALGVAAVLVWGTESQAQQIANTSLAVGSWYGNALPVDPSTSPFPEVVMTPTFLADGNVIANDSHELTNPHATAHGNWVKTGENTIFATFVWLNLTPDVPNGYAGAFRVRLWGEVDPASPDVMTGQVAAHLFPPGTDPLDPDGAGGIDVGTFDIVDLRRIKADEETAVSADLSQELSLGSWYGNALPLDPSTSPFPEVVMTPTFLADGNVIANDSHELTNPHATAHGNWVKTGENTIFATFVWLNLTPDAPNGYAGAFKVRLWGEVDPASPDVMTGQVAAHLFPPGTDPLDPDGTGGIDVGTFDIVDLRRIKADQEMAVSSDLSQELSLGTWYGNALPVDPSTSPFPEVVMTPTFLADGNVIANDSHELTNPHATAHGNWVKTGENTIFATFVWLNLTPDAPNGYAGAFKVRLWGEVDPASPDVMTGQVAAHLFPPGTDPLDPDGTGGIDVGTFDIVDLRRVDARPQGAFLGETTVRATVTDGGSPLVGVELAFSRSVSGRIADYAWSGTTDADGEVTIRIEHAGTPNGGFYVARATNVSTDEVVGRWSSIPVRGGKQIRLTLPVGGRATIESDLALEYVPPLVLSLNQPNPFNPSTSISYHVNDAGEMELTVYNDLGQSVRTLVRDHQAAGSYRVVWDGRDAAGRAVSSGVYYYRLSGMGFSQTQSMLLLK